MAASVNAQVTDSVVTNSTATIGEAASVAMGMLYQAEAQAFAVGMQNLTESQQAMSSVNDAITKVALFKIAKLMA